MHTPTLYIFLLTFAKIQSLYCSPVRQYMYTASWHTLHIPILSERAVPSVTNRHVSMHAHGHIAHTHCFYEATVWQGPAGTCAVREQTTECPRSLLHLLWQLIRPGHKGCTVWGLKGVSWLGMAGLGMGWHESGGKPAYEVPCHVVWRHASVGNNPYKKKKKN